MLQLEPLRNYALFTNMLSTAFYLPTSYGYIWACIRWFPGVISDESRVIPQYKWAIMGFLDSIAGIMQSLSIAKIQNGSLVTLLLQSAIPLSMIITKVGLKTKYKMEKYVGAVIVTAGLVVALLPSFMNPDKSGSDAPDGTTVAIWSTVLMFSVVPMCLSSVYKEKALGDADIDPIYMNGYVALYQFLFAFPLLYPSAMAEGLATGDIWKNLADGAKCFVGIDTLASDSCGNGTLFTCLYLIANLGYNVLIIVLLQYGGSNILWLSITFTVPLANIGFALPFMPNPQSLSPANWAALVIIMLGLIVYRFWPQARAVLGRFIPSLAPRPRLDSSAELTAAQWQGLDEESALAVGQDSPGVGATPGRGTMLHVQTHRHKNAQLGQQSVPGATAAEAPY